MAFISHHWEWRNQRNISFVGISRLRSFSGIFPAAIRPLLPDAGQSEQADLPALGTAIEVEGLTSGLAVKCLLRSGGHEAFQVAPTCEISYNDETKQGYEFQAQLLPVRVQKESPFMIVSIGMNILPGVWGGGNQFGRSLTAYLRSHDVEVVYDLTRKDIDIILLTEPRGGQKNCAFTDEDIRRYCRAVNPFATVIHRVNECDERKGTAGVNARLRQANTCAHHTVFISAWLRDLHLAQGMNPDSHSVIHNGADTWTFHPRGYLPWRGQGPMRLVTHHWDPNPYKGADIYLQVDRLLADPRLRSTLDFTFIGNPPNGVTLRHATMLPPMHGQELADTIRSHHVYLTGSQNEPAGMSHIEGACCGLPLLFRKSGALPEYCADYGLGFTGPDFEQVVAAMAKTYQVWIERIRSYPFTAERMCARYMELFQKLLALRVNAANGLKAVR